MWYIHTIKYSAIKRRYMYLTMLVKKANYKKHALYNPIYLKLKVKNNEFTVKKNKHSGVLSGGGRFSVDSS